MKNLSRRQWLRLGGGVSLLGLGACSTVTTLLAPRTVEITKAELMARLGQQFPMRNTVMDLFEVTCAAPRLTLQPDSNRVLADVDLNARDRIFSKNYVGNLWLSFGLRYEPRDQTIRLQQVTIDRVALKGLPASYEKHLTKLGSWLTEERLQNYVVHRFSPEDLSKADKYGMTVTDIRITQKGLAVVLAPKS
jgi:hypothetical protein